MASEVTTHGVEESGEAERGRWRWGLELGQGRGTLHHTRVSAGGAKSHKARLTPVHTQFCHQAAQDLRGSVWERTGWTGAGGGTRGTRRSLSHTLGMLLGFQSFAWPPLYHSFQKEPSPYSLCLHILHPTGMEAAFSRDLPCHRLAGFTCVTTRPHCFRTGQGRPCSRRLHGFGERG